MLHPSYDSGVGLRGHLGGLNRTLPVLAIARINAKAPEQPCSGAFALVGPAPRRRGVEQVSLPNISPCGWRAWLPSSPHRRVRKETRPTAGAVGGQRRQGQQLTDHGYLAILPNMARRQNPVHASLTLAGGQHYPYDAPAPEALRGEKAHPR